MKMKEVIVVEGKHDSEKLKKYFDVDTIETNGLGLSKEKIKIIKNLNEKRGVILFLDPDSPGEVIRRKLNANIPNCKNAFINKDKAKTSKKVGIEHANKEDLENALSNLITFEDKPNTLSYEDYIELGFNGQADSSKKREVIGNLLFLGKCNAKQLYKRLNMYQINREELEKLLEENYD